MRHLKQPRGPRTGWALRMATPEPLFGKLSPHTGKPFGSEISIGLETRRLVEARVKRDIWLGELRKLALGLEAYSRFSLERAEASAGAIEKQEAMGDGGPYDVDVRSVLEGEIEQANNLPRSKRPPKGTLERFAKIEVILVSGPCWLPAVSAPGI